MSERLPELAGVVLAAGGSTRLGQPKQLLEMDGETLLARAVAQARTVCGAGVVVITGAHHDALVAALRDQPVELCHNVDWQSGVASSLRLAAIALGAQPCSAGLLLVCDQPLVTTGHLAALAALWQNAPSRPAAAAYGAQPGELVPGVPAIVPRSWFAALQTLQGDAGARSLLRADPATQLLELPEAAVDIDTQDDLTHLGVRSGQL